MAFESLADKLQNVFKNLRGKGRLSEADVKAALKEVKMALLEADVSFKVVKQFISSVQDTCGLLLRARITQVVGECIVEFTGVDVCRIEVAELYVEESIQ